ncbi:hypothetical protein BH09SUM1_BH09SUM1_31410 [soil metagenome]
MRIAMGKMMRVATLAMLCAGLFATPALAQGDGGARDAMQKYVKEKGQAVVTLELVLDIKAAYSGQESQSEKKVNALGTVVEENGLVVTALSTVDPGQFYGRMSGKDDNYVTRLKSLKYILEDNTEIEAAVVLRDPDLDLVFLRPITKPEKKFTFIDLKDAKKPEIMDRAFTIARTGRIARRTVLGMSGEIQGIVKGAKPFYIPSSELVSGRAGTPILSVDGKLFGITAVYVFPGGNKGAGDEDEAATYAIIPSADVDAVADQAKDAPPEATPTPGADDDKKADDAKDGDMKSDAPAEAEMPATDKK